MLLCFYVSQGFGYNYIVPIPKIKDNYSKAMTCDNFRGIAISPILSKTFEHCILDRFQSFFITSNNQFGFKKGVSCSFAIRTVCGVVDDIVSKGGTASICALDISKAFDKVNHYALLLKLMDRLVPIELFWFWSLYVVQHRSHLPAAVDVVSVELRGRIGGHHRHAHD